MGGSKKKAVKEKPLDKMTVKELRDLAKESTDLTGVYGMNKPELVTEIKKARGIVEEVSGKTNSTVREIKKKMRELKVVQAAAASEDNLRMARIYKKKINRLKKQTRKPKQAGNHNFFAKAHSPQEKVLRLFRALRLCVWIEA
jgi:phosphoglycerate dehydrogenase-like enzyme